MPLRPVKRTYAVEVEFRNALTKIVRVKAESKPKAEAQALRDNPSALRVKQSDAV